MANVFVNEDSLSDIADAIRGKLGVQTTYKPSEMADAIDSISGGGITPTGTIEITQNGVVDVTNYASADVDVPGGITPTGTKQISITENGTTTEDVTNYASAEITVNVSGGASNENSLLDGTISGAYTNSTVTKLKNYALNGLTGLTSVSFPEVTDIGNNVMQGCTNITSVSFPKATKTGTYAFAGTTKLESVSLPSFSGTVGNFVFNGDSKLAVVDLGSACSGLGGQTFAGCSLLKTVVLRRTSGVVSCNNNTFNNTPFASGGSGGTVYVPNDLINSYKTASNWSTLFNAGTCSFVKIEGSAYE